MFALRSLRRSSRASANARTGRNSALQGVQVVDHLASHMLRSRSRPQLPQYVALPVGGLVTKYPSGRRPQLEARPAFLSNLRLRSGDPQPPLYVDSGRLLCARSGHCLTGSRNASSRPPERHCRWCIIKYFRKSLFHVMELSSRAELGMSVVALIN
jgi:hypothetical protein